MPKYRYVAKTKDGKIQEGFIDAVNQDDLVTSLHDKELTIVSVSEKGGANKRVVKRRFRAGLKLDDMIMYSRQLSTLLGAGIPLLRTLNILSGQITSKRLYYANQMIIKDIEAGLSFRDALAKQPQVFTTLWLNLVETGEISGQMPLIMERLADYLEAEGALKTKVVSALTYPLVLIVAVTGVILFLLLFLVPMFGKIYKDLNIQLPFVTQLIVDISDAVKNNIILFLILAVVGGFSFSGYLKTKTGRYVFDSFRLKLPVFGNLFKMQMENEFTSSLAILIRSGVPILQAISIVAKISSNSVASKALANVSESVREGRSIATPLQEADIYSGIVVQMVAVGEETGELASLLDKAYSFTKLRLDSYVGTLATLIEPIMLVVIGAIVCVIAFAVYMPIFQILTTMPGGM